MPAPTARAGAARRTRAPGGIAGGGPFPGRPSRLSRPLASDPPRALALSAHARKERRESTTAAAAAQLSKEQLAGGEKKKRKGKGKEKAG